MSITKTIILFLFPFSKSNHGEPCLKTTIKTLKLYRGWVIQMLLPDRFYTKIGHIVDNHPGMQTTPDYFRQNVLYKTL